MSTPPNPFGAADRTFIRDRPPRSDALAPPPSPCAVPQLSTTGLGSITFFPARVKNGCPGGVSDRGTLSFGDKYQFLSAGGGISGEFDAITMPSGFRGRFLTDSSNTQGTLLVAQLSYTQVAVTPNQRRVAKALDAFIPAKSGDRETVSIALDELTAQQYPAAFEAIMPSLYASLPTMAFNVANALNTSMFQRMWMQRINGRGFSAAGIDMHPMQAEMGGTDDLGAFALNPTRETKWGTFVDGNGVFANANSGGLLQNYKSQSGGVTAGASYKWCDSLATGVYAGYQGLQAQYDGGSRVTDNAVRFGGFGAFGLGGFYANGLVGGALHTYDMDRSIEFGTIDRTARGDTGAGELDVALSTGYDIKAGNFTFGPVTSLQYTYFNVQGFNETGRTLSISTCRATTAAACFTRSARRPRIAGR
jgi:uncharacterized protein with beta-barrel porin domain